MKSSLRFATLIAVFAMMFASFAVQAQDMETVEPTTFGTIVQSAFSGSFVENADGTYTLTLEGVPAFSSLFINNPEVLTGVYPVLEMVDDWNFADALVGTGVLQTEDTTVEMTLTNPTYDFISVVTYDVEIIAVESVEADKDAVVPETFEIASLFIQLTEEFDTALFAARDARMDTMRASNVESCVPKCGN